MSNYKKTQLIDVIAIAALILLPLIVPRLIGISWRSIRGIGPYFAFEERTGTLVGQLQYSLILILIYSTYSYYKIRPTLVEKYQKSIDDPKNITKSVAQIQNYHRIFSAVASGFGFVVGLLFLPSMLPPFGRLDHSPEKILFFAHFSLVGAIVMIREIF